MTPMKQTPLSQLAIVSAGQAAPKDDEFSDHGIPFVRAGSLDSLLSGKSESDLELVSDETAKLRKLKTYPKGTILFAKSGMSATKDRIYVLDNPAYVVSHLATLIPNGSAHADYLRLALKRFPPSVLIKDPAYPAISLGDIQSYEIPVPEQRDDQIRIAHLLGKVEELIAQRKQYLQQLDNLLKSVFLEMFGDPVRNEKGWDIHPCEKAVFDISSGTSYGGEDRAFASPDEVGVLKISAVTKGTFDPTEFKVVNPAQITKAVRFVKRGDFLFSRANTVELVAACCIVPHDYNQLFLPDKLWVLTLNTEFINAQFFNYLLKNERYRDVVRSLASGGHDSMLNISMKKFMTIDVPCPPVRIQKNFSAVVEKIDGIKSRYQQSLTDLEALYGALSQQAFKGELDLSRVPMPGIQTEEEKSVAAEPLHTPAEQGLAINLPDTDNLLAVLESAEAREGLISQWLEAYCGQLGNAPFSVQHLMAAAQTRLAELHPDNDFVLGAHDYEHIKAWVFEALAAGTLSQAFDDAGNRIQLKAVQA
ncbi:restriction endonuclease subunit S [Acidithiobacillus ferridurans]|uniref:Type-1 restriction enzyme EcoKI specificity protein n=2 Tax=Acidithiobacillus ferridurans TaxID=1232575 RepID=A0A2Z6IMS8_ACIFI|nr:restriction endonuclease subunit S [Acidithiobacillus ferridurans]BBF66024.1 Type-1 restriction enzyme EcoKI specificity protein [Acidithiobacillus ferridurans]